MGKGYGVVLLAEALVERFSPREVAELQDVDRDAQGNIRVTEIDLGRKVKNEVQTRLEQRGIKVTIVDKTIGYELRCAPPIPFDAEYARDLGYAAVHPPARRRPGALITIQGGECRPIPFAEVLDQGSGKGLRRGVDTTTESYQVARDYMVRLGPGDFADEAWVGEAGRRRRARRRRLPRALRPPACLTDRRYARRRAGSRRAASTSRRVLHAAGCHRPVTWFGGPRSGPLAVAAGPGPGRARADPRVRAGATLGHRLFGLRVVDLATGVRRRWGVLRALRRQGRVPRPLGSAGLGPAGRRALARDAAGRRTDRKGPGCLAAPGPCSYPSGRASRLSRSP